ncbi:MAG: SAM-dependent methyltransferase [Rhodospirillales bacterium]|nr:MAG: SAM-dependent methyltransferase [Rhodospirillales bacterium]
MSSRTIALDDALHAYLLDVSLREPEVLRRLRDETLRLPERNMQISPEQGQFMALLVRLMGARQILEVGTFTGYSATVMALAMPAGGRLVACDISESWTAIARRYWAEAGVADRIDLRLGLALETLDGLLAGGAAETFDLCFIDADKPGYRAYYERALVLLRPGGLICVDNVLWGGRVVNPTSDDDDTAAIRAFNRAIRDDPRIDLSLVPIGDGLTLARKRSPGDRDLGQPT